MKVKHWDATEAEKNQIVMKHSAKIADALRLYLKGYDAMCVHMLHEVTAEINGLLAGTIEIERDLDG